MQKVSALVQSGTWTAQSAGTFGGASYVADSNGGHVVPFAGSTQSSTAGASHLARLLSPPPQPTYRRFSALMAVLLIAICACWFYIIGPGYGSLTAVLVVAGLIGDFLITRAAQERCEAAVPAWERQMQQWNALFYCGRCDNVYHSQTCQSASAQNMSHLL